MYTIGEFAALGRVSVRMLRHYDAIDLLQPERVDERTGYRSYGAGQLRELLRIVELREYGCGLDDIAVVLNADDEESALRDLLLRRRVEIEASVAADTDRLARIGERLRRLEGEVMSDVQYRSLEPVTVYAVEGRAPGMGPENVSPVIDPLIGRLLGAIEGAGREPIEPGVFWYDAVPGTEELAVHVAFTADDEPKPADGYDVVELPAVETAAVLVHRGDMPTIGRSWMALMEQLAEDGYRVIGPTREVYVHAPVDRPQSEWVTELIAPVDRA